ncbi:hypothetical protein SD70_00100 [Gordoniibacillus kamchatkensis]|uniref:DUF3899 domain-containing protein n=1 Tax=Gordoniibacillus kamchatkensis TaxID=1590651 RepID=A0ABR5AND4_9BACL|nr:hypothetical protein [Paenibacillus sp. VKM B-2647]KIL42383.1 hypothetical protein SD70_00100 [Paenibacillus sp. VKM B-2647]
MNAVAISNKLFMASLILLMIVFIYHGYGWKRLLLWRRIMDKTDAPQDPNALQDHAEDVRRSMQSDKPFAVLRNPLLWIALAGIAVSIIITL